MARVNQVWAPPLPELERRFCVVPRVGGRNPATRRSMATTTDQCGVATHSLSLRLRFADARALGGIDARGGASTH